MDALILLLNTWPPELLAAIELVLCMLFMLSMLKLYDYSGLYGYAIIVLIAANIEVLKGAQFIFPPHPIAMGTLPFGTIALAFGILTEYYGKTIALKGVRLAFIALGFFILLMLVTVGIHPLYPAALSPDALSLYENDLHIKALFMPLPSILAASLIAYLSSQYTDVITFWLIKNITHKHWLWFRIIIANSLSAFVDTCIFSLLAWKIFSPHPVSLQTLVSVYILGTYPLRLLCSFSLSPLIYLAKYFLPNHTYEHLS